MEKLPMKIQKFPSKTLLSNVLTAGKERDYDYIEYYVDDFKFFYDRTIKIERYHYNQNLLKLIKKAFELELYELLAVLKQKNLLHLENPESPVA